jgi:hypothetical protein
MSSECFICTTSSLDVFVAVLGTAHSTIAEAASVPAHAELLSKFPVITFIVNQLWWPSFLQLPSRSPVVAHYKGFSMELHTRT